MLADPARFLNGTAPPNTTGAVHACVYAPGEDTYDAGNCSPTLFQESLLFTCGMTSEHTLHVGSELTR